MSIILWGRKKRTLASLTQVMHIGIVVDVCIDRPSTHSDGGAWIDRCQALSWYTETLGGDRWLPAQATIAAAWTAAGSATGAVFQASATAGPLTSGRFYAAKSATTATEVFRGIKREYPRAGVAWVAEAGRVIGYDIGTGAMWMVFVRVAVLPYAYLNGTPSSVAASNGVLLIGSSSGCLAVDFLKDTGYQRNASNLQIYTTNIAARNSALFKSIFTTSGSSAIVNTIINDVAITTLENSPIDPATGMPVPTIAVATDGNATYSVSVIKNDGIVANIASDSTGTAVSVEFDGKALKVIRSDGTVYIWNDVTGIATGTAPSQTLTAATVPALLGTVSKQATRAKGSSTGLTRIQRNPTTLANSMVATAGYNFASGWQIGDSRLATICAADGVTESVVGATIINSTFTGTGNLDGWELYLTAVNNGSTDQCSVTNGATSNIGLVRTISSIVIGKTYVISCDLISTSNGYFRVDAEGYPIKAITSAGKYIHSFTASSTSVSFSVVVSGSSSTHTCVFDNIYVNLAEPDRSVKNAGLIVNGTLTKTQVAAGAALCALSGFSAANYLQQPYSANHDYSTTGFSGVFWLKEAPNSAIEYLVNRDSLTPEQAIRLWVSVAGFLVFELYDGTTTRTATGTVAVDDSTPKLVQFDYLAGTMNVYVNTALYATATGAALLTLNNASALLNVGLKVDGTLPLTNGSLTLFRMSATIPSSEQREQAYRDELPLFQPDAQCTIAGTSPAVTALAYDDTTDILHVGTSYGRSSFKNLLRVESEATTVGAPTAIAASGGSIVLAGTSAKLYRPEISFYE